MSILITLLVAAGIIYALAGRASIPVPEAYVIECQGDARIKNAGDSNWYNVKEGQVLKQGQTIKTGGDGEVTINFYNQTVSRIGTNTEVELNALFIDSDNYEQAKTGLGVKIGNVWSRVLNLLDKESEFEIRSDNTVAVVRGTTFNFEVDENDVATVSSLEDSVEVSAVQMEERVNEETGKTEKVLRVLNRVIVSSGTEAVIDQKQSGDELRDIEVAAISQEKKDSTWFKKNIEDSEKFEAYISAKRDEELKKMTGLLPDSKLLYSIKRVAEESRLAAASIIPALGQETKTYTLRRAVELEYLDEIGEKNLSDEDKLRLQKIIDILLANGDISEQDRQWLELRLHTHFYLQRVEIIELESGEDAAEIKRQIEQGEIDALDLINR